MADQKQRLLELNQWWKSGEINSELAGRPRPGYIALVKEGLSDRKILALAGMRRSGKSTIIYQAIRELLKEHEPKRILYLNSEEFEDFDVDKLLELYQEHHGIDIKKEKVFVFIDEIQSLAGWQKRLKHYYDLKYAVKFIVTGSSSALLYKDASESLVGRISFIKVFQLGFQEFLMFNNANAESVSLGSFGDVGSGYNNLLGRKELIRHFFNQYLALGGFPEWFEVNDNEKWTKTLTEEYISLLLYKDIIKIFKIRDPLLLESCFRFVAANTSSRFSFYKMSNYLDADKDTVKQYLYYLSDSLLVHISDFYTKSRLAGSRKEKKIYFCDTGLRRAVSLKEGMGSIVENAVYLHLLRYVSGRPFGKIFYWTDDKRNEVDIVLDLKEGVLPVEVKYSDAVTEKDIKGLLHFMQKFKAKKGIVVTNDIFKKEMIDNKELWFIPAWVFLLVV